MVILITGAGGFLGGRTVEGLVGEGFTVLATARNSGPQARLEGLGAKFVAADLCDAQAVDRMVEGCDVIVHCAAKSSPWGPYQAFYDSNVVATVNLLEAAKKHGIKRFVHVSTPSIYFEYKHRLEVKESDQLPQKMVNHYAATKLLAEEKVLESGVPAILLRPRALIGRGDTVIMPRFLKAYQENKLRKIGSGRNVVSITPVANVVESIRCSLLAGDEALGQAFNITSGEAVPLWDLIEYMLEKMDLRKPLKSLPLPVAMAVANTMEQYSRYFSKKEPALLPYSVGLLVYDMTLDISKARELLNYCPLQTAKEGVDEFIMMSDE